MPSLQYVSNVYYSDSPFRITLAGQLYQYHNEYSSTRLCQGMGEHLSSIPKRTTLGIRFLASFLPTEQLSLVYEVTYTLISHSLSSDNSLGLAYLTYTIKCSMDVGMERQMC